jgi:hypothetical protein
MSELTSCKAVDDKNFILTFDDGDIDRIAGKIEQFFITNGYKLEQGNKKDAVYGRGNAFLRILFGAFIKRFKFSIKIQKNKNNSVRVTMGKAMSGAMGGMIGYRSMKKEHQRICNEIQSIWD